jgi:hypothetical protein
VRPIRPIIRKVLWILSIICAVCLAGVLIFVVVEHETIWAFIDYRTEREKDAFASANPGARQEWHFARLDHEAIAMAIAQCLNRVGDLYNTSSLIYDQLYPSSAPTGIFWGRSSSTNTQFTPKLTTLQRSSVYLSNAIVRARVDTAIAVYDNYMRMNSYQIAIIVLGAITTILISIKAMSSDNKPPYFIIGILAIVFSSIGTATSALNTFHGHRESYSRNQRSLATLRQIHHELAIMMSSEANPDNCHQMTEDNNKRIKDWSTRLTAILNNAEAAGQGEGKAIQDRGIAGNSTNSPVPTLPPPNSPR